MPFLRDKSKLVSRTLALQRMAYKNGLRKSIFNVDHDRYIGEWVDNVKSGKGQELTRTCNLYEGDWKKDLKDGFGLNCWRDDRKILRLEYRGDWKSGYQHGFGVKHYRDGGYYIGYIKKGKRHGFGQMWYADGSYYEGSWKKDLRDGLGMWVRCDGNRYEGPWKDDMKEGKGRFFHLSNGQMQEGIWREDICIYSVLVDIPFRPTALCPTQYPIPELELSNTDQICSAQEALALNVCLCGETCFY